MSGTKLSPTILVFLFIISMYLFDYIIILVINWFLFSDLSSCSCDAAQMAQSTSATPTSTGNRSQTMHASVKSSEPSVLRVFERLSRCPEPAATLHASRRAMMARAS
jgi:hypothetical protein